VSGTGEAEAWAVRVQWGRYAFRDWTGHEPGWETRMPFDDGTAAMDYARELFEHHRAHPNPSQFIVNAFLVCGGNETRLDPREMH
jgi:hypothetical protein